MAGGTSVQLVEIWGTLHTAVDTKWKKKKVIPLIVKIDQTFNVVHNKQRFLYLHFNVCRFSNSTFYMHVTLNIWDGTSSHNCTQRGKRVNPHPTRLSQGQFLFKFFYCMNQLISSSSHILTFNFTLAQIQNISYILKSGTCSLVNNVMQCML